MYKNILLYSEEGQCYLTFSILLYRHARPLTNQFREFLHVHTAQISSDQYLFSFTSSSYQILSTIPSYNPMTSVNIPRTNTNQRAYEVSQ